MRGIAGDAHMTCMLFDINNSTASIPPIAAKIEIRKEGTFGGVTRSASRSPFRPEKSFPQIRLRPAWPVRSAFQRSTEGS